MERNEQNLRHIFFTNCNHPKNRTEKKKKVLVGKKRVAKRISGEKIEVVKQRPQFSKKRQNHSLKASKG